MKVILYLCTAENNRVYKDEDDPEERGFTYLRDATEFEGTLRSPANIMNPIIRFTTRNEPIIGRFDFTKRFNYAYIEGFMRYYFITNMTAITADVFDVEMHVDVLMSWKDQFKRLTATIDRNEFVEECTIPDELRPFTDEFEVFDYESPQNPFSDLDITTLDSPSNWNIVWVFATNGYVVAGSSNGNTVFDIKTIGENKPPIHRVAQNSLERSSSVRIECVSNRDLSQIQKLYFSEGYASSYHLSLRAYPYRVLSELGINSVNKQEILINEQLKIPDNVMEHANIAHDSCLSAVTAMHMFLTPKFAGTEYYRNFEPYSTYSLFLPFYGYYELDSHLIMNKWIDVVYITDLAHGGTAIIIYTIDSSAEIPIYSLLVQLQCDIAYDIYLGTGNANDIKRIKSANTNNAIVDGLLGLFKSPLKGISKLDVVGVATGVVGGEIDMAGGFAKSGIKNSTERISGGSLSVTETELVKWTGFYRAFIRHIVHKPVEEDITHYKSVNGLPCGKSATLGSFHGFTTVSDIHLDRVGCYSDEQDELMDLLRSGVILKNKTK